MIPACLLWRCHSIFDAVAVLNTSLVGNARCKRCLSYAHDDTEDNIRHVGVITDHNKSTVYRMRLLEDAWVHLYIQTDHAAQLD